MDQNGIKQKIESFWEWFVAYRDQIEDFFAEDEVVDKDALIEAINNQVLDFGMFSWEIGPGSNREFYFTISPNGDLRRLEISKQIMREAPDLRDWEFHPAKQAADWDWSFSVYDSFMVERLIDASDWHYVLWKQPSGGIVIILEAPNILHLDEDTKATAGDLVVTKAIGEEAKIRFVSRVEVTDELEEIYREKRFPVRELSRRFGDL